MKPIPLKSFDLFTGYGGFTLALEKVYGNNRAILQKQNTKNLSKIQSEPESGSSRVVGFSEIDKYASAVLKYHWPKTKNYGDITKIDWSTVPDFDLLTGGSPCQDLSIAGKRQGLDGRRSGLFYEYIRALNEKKPKYFIWENVKGALSSSNGWDFASVLIEMAEAGYSIQWQVLNAKDFGVPQNRDRIFVIGTRSDVGSPREIFFERGHGKIHNEQEPSQSIYLESPLRSQRDKAMIEITKNVSDAQRIYDPKGIAKTLKGLGGGQGAKTGLYAVSRQPLKFLDRNQKNIEGDYAYTVDTANTGGVKVGKRVRRLMPIECERLMNIPDDWLKYGVDEKGNLFEVSDSQKYKMAGNGVVVYVVEQILKRLLI